MNQKHPSRPPRSSVTDHSLSKMVLIARGDTGEGLRRLRIEAGTFSA